MIMQANLHTQKYIVGFFVTFVINSLKVSFTVNTLVFIKNTGSVNNCIE